MKLRNLTILLLLLKLSNIYPTVMSLSLFEKNNKRVLIIGTAHANNWKLEQALVDDQFESVIIFDWIKRLKANICFLLEMNKYKIPYLRKLPSLCAQLPVWASDNNFKYNDLSFILSDERTEDFQLIMQIHQHWFIVNSKKKNDEINVNEYKKVVKKRFKDITISKWLAECARLKNDIRQKFEKIKKLISEEGQLFVEQIFSDYQTNYAILENLLTEMRDKSAIDITIDWRAIGNMQLFEHQVKLHFILDASLIVDLLENLEKYDNIVLYTGEAHAAKIRDFLTLCEYKPKFKSGLCDKKIPNKHLKVFENQELKHLLNSTFECNNVCICNKNAHLLCGRCKKIYYCSKECQRADWAEHKHNCNNNKDVKL